MLISISLLSAALLVAPLQDAPLEGGKDVPVPKRLSGKDPVLPQMARDARVQGFLIFEVTVSTDGRITDIRSLRTIPLVDQAAIDAMKTWRYEPTLVDGVARRVKFTEIVDMFLSPGDAVSHYWGQALDPKNQPQVRVLAIGRMALFANKEYKRVAKALTKLATDSEPAVAEAASTALAALPPEKN